MYTINAHVFTTNYGLFEQKSAKISPDVCTSLHISLFTVHAIPSRKVNTRQSGWSMIKRDADKLVNGLGL